MSVGWAWVRPAAPRDIAVPTEDRCTAAEYGLDGVCVDCLDERTLGSACPADECADDPGVCRHGIGQRPCFGCGGQE